MTSTFLNPDRNHVPSSLSDTSTITQSAQFTRALFESSLGGDPLTSRSTMSINDLSFDRDSDLMYEKINHWLKGRIPNVYRKRLFNPESYLKNILEESEKNYRAGFPWRD